MHIRNRSKTVASFTKSRYPLVRLKTAANHSRALAGALRNG